MKRNIAILIMLIFLVSNCKKIDSLTQFDMEYDSSVVIPSSTGINLPFNLFTPEIESNSETTFAVNDTRKDLIEEITLMSLDIELTSPSNGDLGFLNAVNVFISADGLSEVKIAWKDNIPSDIGKTLILETSDEDIKDYIKKDNFVLKLNTTTDEFITSDHHIDVHSVFFVDAKVLGQ